MQSVLYNIEGKGYKLHSCGHSIQMLFGCLIKLSISWNSLTNVPSATKPHPPISKSETPVNMFWLIWYDIFFLFK